MPRADLLKYVQDNMAGWNGEGRFGPPPPKGVGSLTTWAYDMEQWCFKVRRDILVLEKLLIDHKLITRDDIYGDPGDPPPPPAGEI